MQPQWNIKNASTLILFKLRVETYYRYKLKTEEVSKIDQKVIEEQQSSGLNFCQQNSCSAIQKQIGDNQNYNKKMYISSVCPLQSVRSQLLICYARFIIQLIFRQEHFISLIQKNWNTE